MEIEITIEANGDTRIEGKTADLGQECKALTQAIEQALGEVTQTRLKPEYHKPRTAVRTKTA